MRTNTVPAAFAFSTLALCLLGCDPGSGAIKEHGPDVELANKHAKTAQESDANASDTKAPDALPTRSSSERAIAAFEAYNAGQYDEALAYFSDDVELNFAGLPESITGSDAIKQQWEVGRVAFPDNRVGIATILVTDDQVALHVISNATHKGEYAGVAATDKPIGSELLYMMRDAGGKFVEITIYSNPLDIASQIGAAPEGFPPVPVPHMPTGEPTVVEGESNDANLQVARDWYTLLAGDTKTEKIEDLLAADCKHHATASGEHHEGLETAKKNIADMSEAHSDIEVRELELRSAGDYVLATGIWAGKNTGDMGTIKATNKELALDFAELLLIEDGKISESWEFHSPLQMMSQLGLMPQAPDTKAEVAAK